MPSRFEHRVPAALIAVVPVRIALDLTAALPASPPLTHVGTAAIAALLCAAVAARWRAALADPWRWPLLALTLAVGVGALRAATPLDAARYGLHLALPVLWILALRAWPLHAAPQPLPWTLAAGAVAAGSLALLVAGQPADHVLHGWPRLHGPYATLHAHASAMAAFASTSLALAATTRSRSATALGLAAAICVGATFVRGAWLWVAIAVAVALAVRRRWLPLGIFALAGAAAALGPLRARLDDLGAILSATPPPGGWGALGSWRVRIWGDVLRRWVDGGPADVVLGRGLGGHYGLHRHLEPHSDLLAIAVQIGLIGLAAWLAVHAVLLRALLRRASTDDRALAAFAGLCGALTTAVVSNDYAFRPTAALWLTGMAALAVPPRRASTPPAGSAPSPA